MYAGLGVISTYIHEKGIKSHVQQIIGVFRDDIGNIKGKKMVHGVQLNWISNNNMEIILYIRRRLN